MRGFSAPHILLASGNPIKMVQNLNHILSAAELSKITAEIDKNVKALFLLGEGHYNFACTVQAGDWRQKISRYYYGAYNARRAITLKSSGAFSTDSSDHKNVEQLPDTIANRATHVQSLRVLREDRNLADYSHSASVGDLVMDLGTAESAVNIFLTDCRAFLLASGVTL